MKVIINYLKREFLEIINTNEGYLFKNKGNICVLIKENNVEVFKNEGNFYKSSGLVKCESLKTLKHLIKNI